MTKTYGKRQANLISYISFTDKENEKILNYINKGHGIKFIAVKLKRPKEQIKCHIFTNATLRIAFRKESSFRKMAKRAAIAWAIGV
jgi:hypothetical protein